MNKYASKKIIKEVESLASKKYRDKLNLFVIEGLKFIKDINNTKVKYIIVSESFITFNQDLNLDAEIFVTDDKTFLGLSDTATPQGVLAVCEKLSYDQNKIIKGEAPFLLLCENVQDPGNLGTIIRTAESAGVDGIFLSKGTVDLYNPKLIRSTAGAIFNVPIFENIVIDSFADALNGEGFEIIGTYLHTENYYYDTDFRNKVCIVVGNEGNGITENTLEICTEKVKIPIIGKSESLNASIACGIMLYEVVKQRIGG